MNTIKRFAEDLGPMTVLPAVWDVLSAASAKSVGATHLFLSGAALNNVRGYPDRGLLDTEDVCRTVREITNATGLPVMVDAETGFGGLAKLSRLLDELVRAGCTAIMIEDQEIAGQSKVMHNRTPGLCNPEMMIERLELIRSIVGNELQVMARTDYLQGMDFQENLDRLQAYSDAGADWVAAIFAPSKDAIQAVATQFPGKTIVLAASKYNSNDLEYEPSWSDLQEIGPVAVQVTGEYRNVVPLLQKAYTQALTGEWEDLFSSRPDPVWLDEMLGLNRPGMNL